MCIKNITTISNNIYPGDLHRQKGSMADLQLTDDYDEDEAGYLNVEEFWRNVKLRMIAREYPGFEEKHLTQEIELQNR